MSQMKQLVHQGMIFLGVFCFLSFINGPSNPVNQTKRSTNSILSRLASGGGKDSATSGSIDMSCSIPHVNVPRTKIEPIFLPSYPGSGTKLQWEIVEALTGIPTTDDAFSNGHHNVVGIKTHYPCMAGRTFPGAEDILKAIIFVRHPMDSLPTYFDMIYASEQNVPYDPDHLPSAPIKAWIEWRDNAFSRELDTWRKHLEYWLDRYDTFYRLLIPYEHFIDKEYGPELAEMIGEFLSRSDGVSSIPPDDIPCAWKKIVDKFLEKEEESESTPQVSQDGSRNSSKLRHGRHRRLQQRMMQTQPLRPISNTQKTPYQLILEHQKQEAAAGTQQLEIEGQTQQLLDQMNQLQQSMTAAATTQQISLQSGVGGSTALAVNRGATNEENDNDQDSDSGEEEDDEVQNDDPTARPYTNDQRKAIVSVLTTLLEKYNNDHIMAPVMVKYIDEVERRTGH